MIIIIDAYNYIKSVSGQTFIDDRTAQEWIDTFKEYVRVRRNPIILIFDAGPCYFQSKQRHGGVTVVYAGQQQTADDVIKDWLKSNYGADALLVSSDRELCHCASDAGVASVGSYDFYKIFNHVMKQEEEFEQKITQTIHKIDDLLAEEDQDLDQLEYLDQLMEEGSRGLMKGKIIKEQDMPVRVRRGKKASKPDKQLMRKIDKI
ncbi:MAG TPA: NYN domain-containing protein [Candidatus Saccharimonadales bacterium]|nr:NYN domain-containing protein [Candidatus Saccharimonadales bacterium]